MNSDNSFILLGRTGVGKSTLTKILSEDPSIIISNSAKSVTEQTKDYNCEINCFKFNLIDTPGYDDSKGKDDQNYKAIKKYITSRNIKLKGIVLMFSFQDPRFSECHQKGLEKIVKLIPIDNFWDYVTIIFTRYYSSDEDELLEEKRIRLEEFKQTFDVLISAFNKAKGIKIVPFSNIKKIFVDLKIKKTKKYQLNDITSWFKEKSKLEPLYHEVKTEIKWDKIIVRNKENEKEILFDVKFKNYSYYNQKGNIIKTLSIPIEQKKIKELERKDFSKVEDGLTTLGGFSSLLGVSSIYLAMATFFIPPAFVFFLSSVCINAGITWASIGGAELTKKLECYCNSREEKIVNELLIEDDDDD